jgi:hypothetical protein
MNLRPKPPLRSMLISLVSNVNPEIGALVLT